MKRGLLLTVSVVVMVSLALLSCNRRREQQKAEPAPKEKLRVERVEGVGRAEGEPGLVASLVVRNDFRHNVTLESATVELYYSTARICAAELKRPVSVPQRTTATVEVPFGIELSNPLAVYGVWNKVQRGEIDKISLTVVARVKVGPVGRDVKVEKIPLKKVLDMLGVTGEQISKIKL